MTDIESLVDAIRTQTAAIFALADSNRLLVNAMAGADEDDDPDAEPETYMDGSPVR